MVSFRNLSWTAGSSKEEEKPLSSPQIHLEGEPLLRPQLKVGILPRSAGQGLSLDNVCREEHPLPPARDSLPLHQAERGRRQTQAPAAPSAVLWQGMRENLMYSGAFPQSNTYSI